VDTPTQYKLTVGTYEQVSYSFELQQHPDGWHWKVAGVAERSTGISRTRVRAMKGSMAAVARDERPVIGMVKVGELTRVTLELPWFSVWLDVTPFEVATYRDPREFMDMAIHELQNAAYETMKEAVYDACKKVRKS